MCEKLGNSCVNFFIEGLFLQLKVLVSGRCRIRRPPRRLCGTVRRPGGSATRNPRAHLWARRSPQPLGRRDSVVNCRTSIPGLEPSHPGEVERGPATLAVEHVTRANHLRKPDQLPLVQQAKTPTQNQPNRRRRRRLRRLVTTSMQNPGQTHPLLF